MKNNALSLNLNHENQSNPLRRAAHLIIFRLYYTMANRPFYTRIPMEV